MRITKILLFILLMSVSAIAQQQEAGIVLAVNGDVRIESTGVGDSVPATVRSIIYQDDLIITGSDGRVQILFRDDTIMSISPDTELALEDFDFSSTGSSFAANILKGVARVVTGEIVKRNPENFRISTPHASISIRGTTVTTVVLPSGTSAIVNDATIGFPVVMTSRNTSEVISSDATGMVLHTSPDGATIVREATPDEMRLSQNATPSLPVGSETKGADNRNELDNRVISVAPPPPPTTFSGNLSDPLGVVSFDVDLVSGSINNLYAYHAVTPDANDVLEIRQTGALMLDRYGNFAGSTSSGEIAITINTGDYGSTDGVSVSGRASNDTANIRIGLESGGLEYGDLTDTGLVRQ
ncbi:MAG: FecR family protein [Deferribacteraceae bacterium]|jgi:hypothetical protein|nr:FecR family protein [Deferribacteraceae bacterium]